MFEWMLEKVVVFENFGLRFKGYFPTKLGERFNRTHRWTVQQLDNSWGEWIVSDYMSPTDMEIEIDRCIAASSTEAVMELRPHEGNCLFMSVDNLRANVMGMESIIHPDGRVEPVTKASGTEAYLN